MVEGRAAFVKLLDAFEAVIGRRHQAMLEFLREPRTVAEMVSHRFIYRPGVESPLFDRVERRSAELHLDRMKRRGEIEYLDNGQIKAISV